MVMNLSIHVASIPQHTPFDAMVLVVMTNYQQCLLRDLDVPAMRSACVRQHLTMPSRVHFDLDPTLRSAIVETRQKSREINDNLLLKFHVFEDFGKNWMKAQKIHPDAFVQMSLQLAYYTAYGKMAPTYETATTRQFYHGRTETVRSCTSEAKVFVEAMRDGDTSSNHHRHHGDNNGNDTSSSYSKEHRIACLRTACSRHDTLMKECQRAEGLDRHLTGLYLTAVTTPEDSSDAGGYTSSSFSVPDLFLDPAFTTTGGGGNFVLSTSTIGYTDSTGGAAPMLPHGYGLFYSMLPDRIYVFVTSYRDGGSLPADQFCGRVCEALREMRDLLTGGAAKL